MRTLVRLGFDSLQLHLGPKLGRMSDPVNHPSHYHSTYLHAACGKPIECIDIVRHMNFDIGSVVKYCWRAGKKDDEIEDLEKAVWYLQDQIAELKRVRQEALLAEKAKPDREEVLSRLRGGWPDTVRGGPGEFWVLRVVDARTANECWATFNHNPEFLEHPDRERLRSEVLGLIAKLPARESDKLAPWVAEAADDWLAAERERGEHC